MKKKLLLIAMALTLSLTACGKEKESANDGGEAAGAYTAGTYDVTAEGFGGDIKLQFTFTADKLEKIEVVEHNETEGFGKEALEEMMPKIVEAQSVASVDNVSGATVTCDALKAAVENAVTQAGGDAGAWTK